MEIEVSSKRTPRTKDRDGDESSCNSSKHYHNCNTCGKRYPGECRLLVNGGGNCWDDKRGLFFTKNDAKQYIKSIFTKQKSGDYNSDSDSSDNESWKKWMNHAKKMYVLVSADINPSEINIEINNNDIKRYRKQARKYFKKR